MPDDDGSSPSGVNTQGGGHRSGGDARRLSETTTGAVCGPVTNQQQLVLSANLSADLSPAESRALKIIELEFAHDISARSARAYNEILDVLRPSKAG